MRDWWEDWGVFITGMVAIVIAVVFFVGACVAVVMHFDRLGCERTAEVQGVATEYHWTTGCVYVDPDYVVAN